MNARAALKDLLGDLPFGAELYWLMGGQNRKGYGRFNLENLWTHLPDMVSQVQPWAGTSTGTVTL